MCLTKLLICGASGFIGRNLVNYFSKHKSYDVYGTFYKNEPPNVENVKMLNVDLTDEDRVNEIMMGMDIVIQAAATTSGAGDIINKPYYHVTDNAVMNSYIFRSAYQNNVKHVIFFSCTVMYQSGEQVKESDFSADDEMHSAYFGVGWTKVYLEKMCEFYSRISKTKYTAIRHSNIYGPYDKYDLEKSHVFGATMAKVMQTKEGEDVVVWGNGEAARDLLYVDDLVEFVHKAIEKQEQGFELVNVGLGEAIMIRDLVQKIIDCSGKNIKIRFDKSKPNISTKLSLDTKLAYEKFSWLPNTRLEEGIKKTMMWYTKNIIKGA